MEKRIDSKEFAKFYIGEALRLANSEPSFDEFDSKLWEIVAGKFGMSEEEVKYVHHSFHWALFCDGRLNGSNVSPLIYVQYGKGDKSQVRLSKLIIFDEDLDKLVDKHHQKYGSYLEYRLNNPHQAA